MHSCNHAVPVTALTSTEKRNMRCNLLLLPLRGGRVMGSYGQMTLLQPLGTQKRARECESASKTMAQDASRNGSRRFVSRDTRMFTSGCRLVA